MLFKDEVCTNGLFGYEVRLLLLSISKFLSDFGSESILLVPYLIVFLYDLFILSLFNIDAAENPPNTPPAAAPGLFPGLLLVLIGGRAMSPYYDSI